MNKSLSRDMKEAIKGMKKLVASKNMDEFKKKLPEVTSIIDKATKHNLIHRNNAARKKSALAKMMK